VQWAGTRHNTHPSPSVASATNYLLDPYIRHGHHPLVPYGWCVFCPKPPFPGLDWVPESVSPGGRG